MGIPELLSRQLLFLIPFVLTLSHLYGLKGVWMSFPIADILAFLFALIILHRILIISYIGRTNGVKSIEFINWDTIF